MTFFYDLKLLLVQKPTTKVIRTCMIRVNRHGTSTWTLRDLLGADRMSFFFISLEK